MVSIQGSTVVGAGKEVVGLMGAGSGRVNGGQGVVELMEDREYWGPGRNKDEHGHYVMVGLNIYLTLDKYTQ